MEEIIEKTFDECTKYLANLASDKGTVRVIHASAELIASSFVNGKRVFSCGNGGSMCDAMHFAEELSGRFRDSRKALPATAISDPGYISCTANDFGYEHIFSRYIEAHATEGDVLLAISTSGKSQNVLNAAKVAKEIGAKTIALTGKKDCLLGDVADFHIAAPAGNYADRVQELHIKIIHLFIELVERKLFPENYQR